MKNREKELEQAEAENRLTPSGYQELQSLRRKQKETLNNLIEDIANWNGVYGCGDEKMINDGHPDNCRCRICYTIGLEDRIMTAVYGEERNMFKSRIALLGKGESVVLQISDLYGFAFTRRDADLLFVLGVFVVHEVEGFYNRFHGN